MSDADRALATLAQRRTPSTGVPTPWHDETTGVHTDGQVFRALKALHGEMEANKAAAAKAHGALSARVTALTAKVEGIEKTVGGFDQKLDRVAENSAETAGAVKAMLSQRSRPPSGETRAVAKEALAEQVLAEAREGKRFSRKAILMILGGVIGLVTSGAFLHWAFEGRSEGPRPRVEMRSVP